MNLKNKEKIILISIIILGIILRVVFSVVFSFDFFQIDLGIKDCSFQTNDKEIYDNLINQYTYDNIDTNKNYIVKGGHLEYILTIYNTGHLPEKNYNQLYHPPLSQILFAVFLRIESIFIKNSKFLLESLEFLSIFYSIFMIYVFYKILKELNFEDKDTILPISILTFHPLSIFLSRIINTDGLLSLLVLYSILYLIRWYKNPSYKNVIILGILVRPNQYDKNIRIGYVFTINDYIY